VSRLVVTEIAITQVGESPVIGENTVTVRVEDDGAGSFLVISNIEQVGAVRIDFEEAELLILAIRRLRREAGDE